MLPVTDTMSLPITLSSSFYWAGEGSIERTLQRETNAEHKDEVDDHHYPVNEVSFMIVSRDSIHPQYRLSNEEVANHLFNVRVSRQLLPKLDVIVAIESDSRKEQAVLSHRPLIVVHHVRLQWPGFLFANERRHVVYRAPEAAAIGCLKCEEVVPRRRKNLADRRHCFEVEQRIAIGLRSS